jgi:hypothetical protein
MYFYFGSLEGRSYYYNTNRNDNTYQFHLSSDVYKPSNTFQGNTGITLNNTAPIKRRGARTFASLASFRKDYDAHVAEREKDGIPPLPLSKDQVQSVCEFLSGAKGAAGGDANSPVAGQDEGLWLKELLFNRVPAGVDDAARVKAGFLEDIVKGNHTSAYITKLEAVNSLAQMLGGYNVATLVDCLDMEDELASAAQKALSHTLLVRIE